MNTDLNTYANFVHNLTSNTSKHLASAVNRLEDLDENRLEDGTQGPKFNVPLLMTAAMGMCSETGEFMEVVKKCLWQGKPFTEEVRFHLKRELGDQMFYWTQACVALGYSIDEVIEENKTKLSARYPAGHFETFYSENRQQGDL